LFYYLKLIDTDDSFFLTEIIIQHHTHYFIFMRLVYGRQGIADSKRMGNINSKDARRSRTDWMINAIMILSFYELTGDTVNFILKRLENVI